MGFHFQISGLPRESLLYLAENDISPKWNESRERDALDLTRLCNTVTSIGAKKLALQKIRPLSLISEEAKSTQAI